MTEPTQKNRASELNGLAAIVTGSARNIGRAIALALSAAGASVTIMRAARAMRRKRSWRKLSGRVETHCYRWPT